MKGRESHRGGGRVKERRRQKKPPACTFPCKQLRDPRLGKRAADVMEYLVHQPNEAFVAHTEE